MGQFSLTDTVEATWPTGVTGGWYIWDNAAANIYVHYDNEVLVSGSNAAVFGRLYYNTSPTFSGATQWGTQPPTFGGTDMPKVHTYATAGLPGGVYVAGFVGANTSGNTIQMDISLYDDLTYCDYGAQRRSGSPDLFYWTYEGAVAILTYAKASPLASLIGFILGQVTNVPLLCSAVRPPLVELDAQDYLHLYGLGSPGELAAAKIKLTQFFLWCAWGYFCECVPGSPDPIEPPIIPIPPPPGLPTDPNLTFVCDNNDLCSQMLKVNVALNAIIQRQTTLEQLVTLIQRQGVPFGYVPGTAHAGLSGQGDFTVADILGLAVEFTTLPPLYPPLGGDPPTYHQLGKISVGTADGWERSWWPTHSPYLILPVSGAATRVGWTFPVGIVATITELVREP